MERHQAPLGTAIAAIKKRETGYISDKILRLLPGRRKRNDGASRPVGVDSETLSLELSEIDSLPRSLETNITPSSSDARSDDLRIHPPKVARDPAYPVITGGTSSPVALPQPTGSQSGMGRRSSDPGLDPTAFLNPKRIPYLKAKTVVFPLADRYISDEHKKRFPVVKDCFKENIYKDRELSREGLATIVCQLAMCGIDMNDASPSILVFCHPKAIKRVRNCLTRRHVRQQYEGGTGSMKYPVFPVFFWAETITLLGESVDLVDVPYNPGSSLCASPVLSVEDGIKLCTVSCILMKDSKPYALTSAHNFDQLNPVAESLPPSDGSSEPETEDGDSEYDFPHDLCCCQEIDTRQTQNLAGTSSEPALERHNMQYSHMARSCLVTRPPPFLLRERIAQEILQILPGSHNLSRQNLDWALVELDKSEEWFPNRFRCPSPDGLEIDDWYINPDPVGVAPKAERNVVIALSTGPILGKIRPHSSFVGNWDNTKAWLQVWTVFLGNALQSLKKGDSGALVIDCESRRPYGHLIAANPLGDGYVIPLAATLQQIKYVFNSTDIKLLSAGHELLEIERRRLPGRVKDRVIEGCRSAKSLATRLRNRPNQWSSSVGTERGHLMDKDGNRKYVCFEAIGPGRVKWNSLGPEISSLLSTAESESVTAPQLAVNFYLIGRDIENLTPVVLFTSEDKETRKDARMKIQESGIMDEARYRGICLGDAPTTPSLLALEDIKYLDVLPRASRPDDDDNPVLSVPTDNAFGRRLHVPNINGISMRPATAGPVLYINDQVFQLTVGHAHTFPSAGEQLAQSTEADPGLWDIDGFEECRSNLGDLATAKHPKSQFKSAIERERIPGDTLAMVAESSSKSAYITAANTAAMAPPSLKRIGKISLVSSPELDEELDYALIKLETSVHRPNRIPLGTSWLRVTNIWAGDAKDAQVVVMTGSSGLLSGTLSATPSYLRFPWRRNLQQVYPATLNGTLRQGDCGAAVVNRMNGDFHGHLVAGIEGSGLGYIIPASKVISDISSRLKAVVGLGGQSHTKALLGWAEFGSNRHVMRLPAVSQQPQLESQDTTSSGQRQQQQQPAEEKRMSNLVEPHIITSTIEATGSQQRHGPLAGGAFQDRFFSLPIELEALVLGWLPIVDLLSLRLVSRSWNNLIVLNEALISRHYLQQGHVPPFITHLFPPPGLANPDLRYIAGLWYRFKVSSKLSASMADWLMTDFFLARGEGARRDALHVQERFLRRRMTVLLFAIFHFLEMYRGALLTLSQARQLNGVNEIIQRQIINCYDNDILLQMHQLFPVLVTFLTRRLRPPSYLGTIERHVRGYTRSPPAERVQVAVICIGGLPGLLRLAGANMSYEARISAVDRWYAELTTIAEQSTTKGWNTFMPTRQLASTLQNLTVPNAKAKKGIGRQRGEDDKDDNQARERGNKGKGREVFPVVSKSSLSSGPPEQKIAPNDMKEMLQQLPATKNQIWRTVAEDALIARGVVGRIQDILRDADVLQALISLNRTRYERLFDGSDFEQAD